MVVYGFCRHCMYISEGRFWPSSILRCVPAWGKMNLYCKRNLSQLTQSGSTSHIHHWFLWFSVFTGRMVVICTIYFSLKITLQARFKYLWVIHGNIWFAKPLFLLGSMLPPGPVTCSQALCTQEGKVQFKHVIHIYRILKTGWFTHTQKSSAFNSFLTESRSLIL